MASCWVCGKPAEARLENPARCEKHRRYTSQKPCGCFCRRGRESRLCRKCSEVRVEAAPKDLPSVSGDRVEVVEDGNSRRIDARFRGNLRTLEELLEATETDLEKWAVSKHVLNHWGVGAKNAEGKLEVSPIYQVKAWLDRRVEKLGLEEIEQGIMEFLSDHAPARCRRPSLRFKSDYYRHMLEIMAPDVHLGKLAWSEETGEDYDLKIACEAFRWSIDQLLFKARHVTPEKIVFPLGNDFLHTDNLDALTPKGKNRLDVDSRWPKLFMAGFELAVESIEKMRKVAPEVEVVMIAGNHDMQSTFSLGLCLEAHYRKTPGVSIDLRPKKRKYLRFGKCLLGLGHGDGKKEKGKDIDRIMASEASNLWSGAVFKEMHLGHVHHRVVRDELKEFNGVIVRWLSALSASDAWHYQEGYVGNIRAAQSFLWNFEAGVSEIHFANLPKDAAEKIA